MGFVQHQGLRGGVHAFLADWEQPLDIAMMNLQQVIAAAPFLVHILDQLAFRNGLNSVGKEEEVLVGGGIVALAGVAGAVALAVGHHGGGCLVAMTATSSTARRGTVTAGCGGAVAGETAHVS